MARIQMATCRHCGERTTVGGPDGSRLPRWSVCRGCAEGVRLMERYGDCDELLFLIEGQDALSTHIRFRSVKQEGAYEEALEKAMEDHGVSLGL